MYQSQAMLIFKGTIYGNKPVLITNWSWHVLPYITGEIAQNVTDYMVYGILY